MIDLAAGRVRAPDGTETELRVQSADVLRALAARRGETVTKDELHAAVWGDIAVTEDSLVQCVGDIRRALGDARDAVQTLRGRGYRLAADQAAALRTTWWRRPGAVLAGVAVLLIVLGGLWQQLRDSDPDVARVSHTGPVVAVLPFENLSGGERWDRLAQGLTQEVIADLAQSEWIFVFADATSRGHAGAAPGELRAKLGADYTVTGSVLAGGDRVRIAAALADAANGRQLWARQWQGPPDDVLALQADASEALVGELAGHWSGAIALADRNRAHEAGTESLDAYDLYLLGIEHKHRMTPRDFVLAEEYLLQAVAVDPNFARAWVAVSIVMGFRASSTTDESEVAEFTDRFREYSARAVDADPDDPSVLLQAGWAASIDGDFEAAGRAIRRAVERAPNDADVLAVAAWSGPGAGIFAEANAWADHALALNPAAPSWYQLAKGTAAFSAGD